MASEDGWMAFVDGENFTIQAQEVASENGLNLVEGEYFKRDCFIWLPTIPGRGPIVKGDLLGYNPAVRASYYTSVHGSVDLVKEVRESLWRLGFDGHVFKKTRKEEKSKGVDIALSKDMLSHAFMGNFSIAVLVAGDGDYVPLVEEVKRLGKQVFVGFFSKGLNDELRLASDQFSDMTEPLITSWRAAPEN